MIFLRLRHIQINNCIYRKSLLLFYEKILQEVGEIAKNSSENSPGRSTTQTWLPDLFMDNHLDCDSYHFCLANVLFTGIDHRSIFIHNFSWIRNNNYCYCYSRLCYPLSKIRLNTFFDVGMYQYLFILVSRINTQLCGNS